MATNIQKFEVRTVGVLPLVTVERSGSTRSVFPLDLVFLHFI